MILNLQAHNFMSWTALDFSFEPGVSLIRGPEGAGKSAVLNALCWGFYGKVPKNVKVSEIVKENEKSCSVVITLNHPEIAKIVRTRGPNDLYLISNNGDELRGKDAKATQNVIDEILDINYDTYCKSVYFPQNYSLNFLSINQEMKGQILSELQNLTVFDKSRDEVKSDIKKNQTEIQSLLSTIQKLDSNQRIIQSHITNNESLLKSLDLKQDQVDVQVESVNQSITSINQAVSDFVEEDTQELQNQISDLANLEVTLNKKIKDSNNEIFEMGQDLGSLNKFEVLSHGIDREISSLEHEKTKVMKGGACPTCDTPYTSEDKIKSHLDGIKKKQQDLSQTKVGYQLEMSAINPLKELLKSKSDALSEIQSQKISISHDQAKIQHEINRIISNKESIKTAKDNLKFYHHQLEVLKNSNTDAERADLTSAIESGKEDLTNTISQSESLHSQIKGIEYHLISLNLLKDSFREIKVFIFEDLLKTLEYKTNIYLETLFDSNAEIRLFKEGLKIECQIAIDGRERSVGQLSGGQMKRFSLAVDLALSDLVDSNNQNSMGLIMLDEPFQNLSEPSMIKCVELLDTLDKQVIIIEHNSIASSIVQNSYNIEYLNGESRWA